MDRRVWKRSTPALPRESPAAVEFPAAARLTSGRSPADPGGTLVVATRDSGGAYAFVYIPTANQSVTIDLTKLGGPDVKAWWFDPRAGTATVVGTYPNTGTRSFTSPANGPDVVLVLDDADRGFVTPGG